MEEDDREEDDKDTEIDDDDLVGTFGMNGVFVSILETL